MKKLTILILSLFVLTNAFADDWPHQNISKAEFATEIIDREPSNIVGELNNTLGKIYFFTNIRNLQGTSITHRWIYNNKVMADVVFDIKGPRWRVWSSKIFGITGQVNGLLKYLLLKMKCYIKKNLTT